MLRAAVVGVGYLGNFHAQKYKALSQNPENDLTLVGVCDANPEQAKKIAAELGVSAFSKPEDLIGKVDLVTIATITPVHYALTKLFLENGIHVNVEKPISLKSSESAELVALAEKKSLKLAVGHSERFSSAFVAFKKKAIKPKFLEFNRHAPFKARGSEVSVIHDLMIHDLDLMLSMDSSKVRVVSASGGKTVTDSYDWASATFEFESGLKAIVNSSRVASAMTRTARAYLADSVLIANMQTFDLETTQKSGTSQLELTVQTENCGKTDNLLAETETFIRAVQGRAQLVVTGRDGHKALELAEQVIALIGQ